MACCCCTMLLAVFAGWMFMSFVVKQPQFRVITWMVVVIGVCVTLNIPMFLGGIGLRWIYRPGAKWVASQMARGLWWTMSYVAECHQDMKITISGDVPPEGENGVIIANHVGFPDFYLIQAVTHRMGMLANAKYVVKKSLQFIPFFGWGMYMMEMIAVARNWLKDKASIEAAFENVKKDKGRFLLVMFVEGTRQTPKNLKDSQEFCKTKGLPVFNRVLYPRKQGFVATIGALRGSHVTHVYDFTLLYQDLANPDKTLGQPAMTHLHSVGCKESHRFHVHVTRHAIADLPEDSEALGKWLEERYILKDKIVEDAHTEGMWPGEAKSPYPANTYPFTNGAFYAKK